MNGAEQAALRRLLFLMYLLQRDTTISYEFFPADAHSSLTHTLCARSVAAAASATAVSATAAATAAAAALIAAAASLVTAARRAVVAVRRRLQLQHATQPRPFNHDYGIHAHCHLLAN